MQANSTPVLSIGIIFKNEIRCLERCMKALEPLRSAVPCELVMADTGSEDGSREIAQQYADILFDFPWIDDFAAARNAVMDRSTGKWFMSIDCDEWLDGEISELVGFLTKEHEFNYGLVKIRNYATRRFDEVGGFDDFFTARLVLMSTGKRFVGAIHENWALGEDKNAKGVMLQHTIFHHDGYVRDESYTEKCHERNIKIIRKEMEQRPDDLVLLMQFLDSAQTHEDFPKVAEMALDCVERKVRYWEVIGPPVIRTVAHYYQSRDKQRCVRLLDLAEEKFPNSIFTKLDVGYLRMVIAYETGDYETVTRRYEDFIRVFEDYAQKRFDQKELSYSTVFFGTKNWKNIIYVFTANAYLQLGEYEKCRDFLKTIEGDSLRDQVLKNAQQTMQWLYCQSDLDTDELVCWMWEQIQAEALEEDRQARETQFKLCASATFNRDYRTTEMENPKFRRPAWQLYAALRGKTGVGTGAALELARDTIEAELIMAEVTDWKEVPIQGLARALYLGSDVPRVDTVEEIGELAGRLGVCPELFPVAMSGLESMGEKDLYHLLWAKGLVNGAVRLNDWQDVAYSMNLCRTFVNVERQYLNCYYSQDILREENLFAMNAVDRFGWYCWWAFHELEKGKTTEFVRLLRQGLDACKSMKGMVEFLLEHTEALKPAIQVTPELLAMAEQVKAILAMYAPDDPAVMAIKQSEAYQKVAALIEEPSGIGGVSQ